MLTRRTRKKFLGSGLLMASLVTAAHAATITSTTGGGLWNTPGTWVGGVVPTAADDVVIATTGGADVEVSANVEALSITLQGGAALQQNGATTIRVFNDFVGAVGSFHSAGGLCTLQVDGNFTTSGATLATELATVVDGTATFNASAFISNNIGGFNFRGDVVFDGSGAIGFVTFSGSSGTQTVTGSVSPINIPILTIDNVDGVVFPTQSLNVTDTLDFMNGIIFLNTLAQSVVVGNLGTGSPGTITGAGLNNYVSGGGVTRVIPAAGLPTSFLFPVGNYLLGGYTQVELDFVNRSTLGQVRVRSVPQQHPRLLGNPAAIARYWEITEPTSLGFFTTNIAFAYNANDETNFDANITSPGDLKVARWLGGTWSSNPGAADGFITNFVGAVNPAPTAEAVVSGITAFSDWTIIESPILSVDLESFTASASQPGDKPVISWSTSGETDNAGFHLYLGNPEEGSAVRLTQSLIPAEGDLGSTYGFIDPLPMSSGETRSYYLEDVEFDGDTAVHGPATVSVGFKELDLALEQLTLENWKLNTVGEFVAADSSNDESGLSLSIPADANGVFGSWETADALEALPAGTYVISADIEYTGTVAEGDALPDVRLRVFEEDFDTSWMTQAVDRSEGNASGETITTEWTTEGGKAWKVAIDLLAFQEGMAGGFTITNVNVQAK